MEVFLTYFLLFIIYSLLGWLIESIFCAFIDKKFINRGFLIGPYCPIYGVGAIIMTLYLTQYKDNPITVFLLASILCSILEYLTSYIMEKIFKTRWWDYSNHKFNLNGRICLSNTLGFGFLSLVVIYITNPFFFHLIDIVPNLAMIIISIIIFLIFITDVGLSFNIIYKIKKTADSIKTIRKDNTEEISKKVRKILNTKIFQRRIINAFPKLKILPRRKSK